MSATLKKLHAAPHRVDAACEHCERLGRVVDRLEEERAQAETRAGILREDKEALMVRLEEAEEALFDAVETLDQAKFRIQVLEQNLRAALECH
jgi:predicted  nucleic acid-binding Zn-ribbon protein